jgi:hypothetical protein
LLRGLDHRRYSKDELSWLFWGVGAQLGTPWPQNRFGHLLGDVTDKGKSIDDPTARGNELGGVRLDFHSDASDLVGLLCLNTAMSGGLSAVANVVTIHNELVRSRPDLASELYHAQPFDFRGEEEPNQPKWYPMPVFTEWRGRLFVRFIRPYILEAQRHPGAPAVTELAQEALAAIDDLAESGRFTVLMDFRPGDMQFINNYHVLHDRTAYVDDQSAGRVRHLKRLWLETDLLTDRPPHFRKPMGEHWSRSRTLDPSMMPPA